MGEAEVDTVIIGAGVVGAASAYWLAGTGRRVRVLERRPSIGSLTTPNALGTIRTQYGTPTLIELAKESLAFYQGIEQHLPVSRADIGWANHGYLYLTDNPDREDRLRQSLAHYQTLGVTSSELVAGAELQQRFPYVGDAVAGIFHGDGSWVDPARITGAWMAGAEARGALVETDVGVTALSPSGPGWTVTTSKGDIEANEVVVCAGPYAPRLLANFGVDAPLRITPRYKAFVPNPSDGSELLPAAAPLVINIANGAYWRPVPGGVWLSTANVDDESVEPRDSVSPPDDFVQVCIDEIEPVSPLLAARAREAQEQGLVTVTGGFQVYPADDVPYIGSIRGHKNLYANYGHWAGVMLAPASGRLLRDVMDGGLNHDDNPCRLTRFDDQDAEEALSRKSTNKFGGWG